MLVRTLPGPMQLGLKNWAFVPKILF